MTKIADRFLLISNLDYVTIRDVRTFTHALLMVTEEHPLQRGRTRHLLRGFSTTPSVPTFDIEVPTSAFTLRCKGHDPSLAALNTDNDLVPLLGEVFIEIPGFGDVRLSASVNSQKGIDIKKYPEGTTISEVWTELERKVISYWESPAIMMPRWVPIDMLR